jgi:hypothetical protein
VLQSHPFLIGRTNWRKPYAIVYEYISLVLFTVRVLPEAILAAPRSSSSFTPLPPDEAPKDDNGNTSAAEQYIHPIHNVYVLVPDPGRRHNTQTYRLANKIG